MYVLEQEPEIDIHTHAMWRKYTALRYRALFPVRSAWQVNVNGSVSLLQAHPQTRTDRQADRDRKTEIRNRNVKERTKEWSTDRQTQTETQTQTDTEKNRILPVDKKKLKRKRQVSIHLKIATNPGQCGERKKLTEKEKKSIQARRQLYMPDNSWGESGSVRSALHGE